MAESRATYRYALALTGVAEETKKVDEVTRDFEFIESVIEGSHEFLQFLKSPVIRAVKKKAVLSAILQGRVSEITLKFVITLVTRSREGLLPDVIRQFYRLRDEHRNILNVTTRVAVPFSEKQHKDLCSRLAEATKKNVQIKYVVDPSLKGGFMIQHDDTVWDASVRHQLELLRRRFAEGGV